MLLMTGHVICLSPKAFDKQPFCAVLFCLALFCYVMWVTCNNKQSFSWFICHLSQKYLIFNKIAQTAGHFKKCRWLIFIFWAIHHPRYSRINTRQETSAHNNQTDSLIFRRLELVREGACGRARAVWKSGYQTGRTSQIHRGDEIRWVKILEEKTSSIVQKVHCRCDWKKPIIIFYQFDKFKNANDMILKENAKLEKQMSQ